MPEVHRCHRSADSLLSCRLPPICVSGRYAETRGFDLAWGCRMRPFLTDRVRALALVSPIAVAAAAVVLSPEGSWADEGGVSFWVPGQFGSLAAVPAQPGWSFASIGYFTDVRASGGVAAARQITIGRLSPTVNVDLNATLHARVPTVFVNANHVFETPVLGGQFAFGMTGAAAQLDRLTIRAQGAFDATLLQVDVRDRREVKRALDRQPVPATQLIGLLQAREGGLGLVHRAMDVREVVQREHPLFRIAHERRHRQGFLEDLLRGFAVLLSFAVFLSRSSRRGWVKKPLGFCGVLCSILVHLSDRTRRYCRVRAFGLAGAGTVARETHAVGPS